MNTTLIAVDLAKDVFELACANRAWRIVDRKRLNRKQCHRFCSQHPPVTFVLEACGTAHHWARELQAMGHRVRLLPAQYIRAYVRRSKTDRHDAAAIVEAARNREIRPVPVKSVDQQCIQTLHRVRSQWMATRTARINALRGLLRELGYPLPLGAANAIKGARGCFEQLPQTVQPAVSALLDEIHELQDRAAAIEAHLKQHASQSDTVQRLLTVPGIGLLTATALNAAAGYVRMLLVHGARAVLNRAIQLTKAGQPLSRLQQWAVTLERRIGHNKAAVALANKLARIAWAVWHNNTAYVAVSP